MSRGEQTSGNDRDQMIPSGSGKEAADCSGESFRSYEVFFANVRHELRTPLNAVIGYSEMLLEDAKPLDYRDFIPGLRQIHAAGKQLLIIVNDLMDPIRFEAGGAKPDLEELRLSLCRELPSPLNTVLDSSRALILSTGAAGHEALTSDLGKIHSAAKKLMVFINGAETFLSIGAGMKPDAPVSSETLPLEEDPGQAVERGRLLVVDDNEMNRDLLSRYLEKQGHIVLLAENGFRALEMVKEHVFDLVLLDIMMDGMDGYEVCRTLKSDSRTRDIPVLFLSAMAELSDKTAGFEAGAVDYITKPFHMLEVRARVGTHLLLAFARRALANQNAILERKVKERTREIEETQKEIILRLGLATEMRDTDTGMHVKRIRGYSELLARKYGLSSEESELIGMASTLHDIGKIGIPDHILLKAGKLEYAEMAVMKTHSVIGARSLDGSRAELIEMAKIIALTHHERWDGKGYPTGLKGEEIPLAGRIVSLADVFDALTTKRPYKDAWTVEKAVQLIRECRGTQFDPMLADIFLDSLPEIVAIREEFSG